VLVVTLLSQFYTMEETDPVDEVAAGIEKTGVNDTVDIEANPKPRARPRRFIRRKKVDSATSTPTEDDGTNVRENAITLPAEVLRGQQEAGKAVIDTLELHIALVEKLEDKLNEAFDQTKEARSECRRQEKRLVQAQKELKAAKDKAEDLADRQGLRKTTTDIQFRKYTIKSEPGCAKFDFVQTFTTSPTWGINNAVLAYTKIDGKPHLAQNGKHPETTDGIIDGKLYSERACNLFRLLVDWPTEKDTIYQHAEAQLMTLHIEKFRNLGLSPQQFKDLHGASFAGETLELEIFVSQPPCWFCKVLMETANKKAEEYGFKFSLEDISINQATPEDEDAKVEV